MILYFIALGVVGDRRSNGAREDIVNLKAKLKVRSTNKFPTQVIN